MRDVSSFLQKYAKLEPPHRSVIRLFIAAVKDECGIALSEQAVTIGRGGVFLTCHPAARSEVLRCAPHVLTHLNERYQIRLTFVR